MSNDLLQDLLTSGERHARICLMEEGEEEVAPFYHLVSADGGHSLVLVQWRDEVDKRMVVQAVKEAARQFDAVAAMLVTEAWAADYDSDGPGPDDPRPSQHPERIEIVSLVATDSKRMVGRVLEIKRDASGHITELERRPDQSAEIISPMLDILPARVLH